MYQAIARTNLLINYLRPRTYRNALLLGILSLVITVISSAFIGLFDLGESLRVQRDNYDFGFLLFFSMVILAPLLETVINQFFVIFVLLKLKASPAIAAIISAVLFAYAHFFREPFSINVILQAFPDFLGGLFLATIFLGVYKLETWNKAILYTAFVHGIHNGILVALIWILEYL